jgi:hypothetical protein
MTIIESHQFDSLESEFRSRRRQRLAAIFSVRYEGLVRGVAEQDVVAYIDAVIEDTGSTDAHADDEVVEFAAIGVLCLSPEVGPELVALIRRVVLDEASTARQRLDFIWTRLMPRYAADKGQGASRHG